MTNWIAGPGLNLPTSQALFPPSLQGAAAVAATYRVDIPTGGCMLIPAGEWIVSTVATVGAIQWYDGTVSGEWKNFAAPAAFDKRIESDGVNFRVANLSDSAFGGIVTTPGTGYTAATTTVTPGTGNSTWVPVIGGSLTATVTTAGSGYTKNPLLLVPEPPYPGVTATMRAAITAGAVSGVTVTNAGAGYITAPTIVVVTDPFDPGINSVVSAVITATVGGAGTVTGLLLVNFGAPLTTAPTLTVSGLGASAVVTTNPAAVVAAAVMTVTFQRC